MLNKVKKKSNEKKIRKIIAKERIIYLMYLYKSIEDIELGRKLAMLAFSLKKRFRVKLDSKYNFSFCRKCFLPWIAGKTVLVRFNSREKKMLYICKCGYVRVFKYGSKG